LGKTPPAISYSLRGMPGESEISRKYCLLVDLIIVTPQPPVNIEASLKVFFLNDSVVGGADDGYSFWGWRASEQLDFVNLNKNKIRLLNHGRVRT